METLRQVIRSNSLLFATTMTVLLVLPSFLAWLQKHTSQITNLTLYEVFPLLGLLAFSLMLAHVAVGAVGLLLGMDMRHLRNYYRYTGYAVLACILLHPGLFIWQLYQDGYGFPPSSYLSYVDSSLRVFVLFGSISFVIFLLYELKRQYGAASWWHYVERASDGALVLVFVHGLYLGSQTQAGWFRVVWIVYGALLFTCLIFGFVQRQASIKAR